MSDMNHQLTAILDGHTCGSTTSLLDGRRDRSCPGCIEERDQQWSEALDPTCLAEFTPGIAAEYVKALQEAAEREKARADLAEQERDLYRRGYEARGKLCIAYRTGGHPSEKTLDELNEVARMV